MTALDHKPQVTTDDGADPGFDDAYQTQELIKNVIGGTEETTHGRDPPAATHAKANALKYPIYRRQ